MENITDRVTKLEQKADLSELIQQNKQLSDRIEVLESIIEDKLGFYISKRR
jgi:hypothetical protein